MDAGETIDLALVIKNHGNSRQREVTLEVRPTALLQALILMRIATNSELRRVGSFNEDDNGLIYDDEQYITGGILAHSRWPIRPTAHNPHARDNDSDKWIRPNDSNTTRLPHGSISLFSGRELPE